MTTSPSSLNILIVGAGVCGPALALMLQRSNPNHVITVIERFPTLRTGGQQIDIKAQGIPILEKLGLLNTIRSYCVKEGGMEFVDRNGKSLMQFGITKAGDTAGALTLTHEFEFMRGNFVKMMHDISIQEREILTTRGHVKGGLTYEFGKTITALSHSESSSSPKTATVTFSTGETRTFDLVIAADGQASRTRSLAFGSEISSSAFHSMNIHAAYYKIPRLPTEDSLARIYFASNNRMVMTRTGNQPATQVYLFLMNGKDRDRASHMATYQKRSAEEQKDAWKSLYQDAGWECPRFLQGLDTVKDFYATEIGQVKMPQHKLYKDRVVLLGDAGYCPSPFTGMGTTLSLIGAYVLAGELFRHGDDVDAALEAYQEAMKQPVEECQKLGPYADGKGPLPSSEWGLWMAGWALWTVSSLRVDRVIGWLAGLLPEGKEKRWEMPEYTEFNLKALERE
ncbi:FAD/NAD(P)-binding domain-containing protein [Alternaria alternata]|uniref:FAD/NAD(P)-binding domain-containing protein n=2 Tax=Alternaria alternata complex TaxID=187734 RepID=A0A177D2Y6_ALTAL|nr:FAD/NAD(P)-binding domain-containing protein [Alternaria alternata]RYN17833.1 hypothetical protein AA0115_g11587 [Alternaria tenuissima]OAG13500.1 FAD/NAD(P)-binding domain-containing protein [Alternaria alternata]RYN70997.1 hypothetical protein AA0117_g9886 [Alternaria alternata]RYO00624.1 hypothetical protein AA0119_g5932 [Alternaria tenuissima]RYO14427.1 hypothetical protein AA0121_g7723 [Alternaria tenuissima]